MIFKGIEFTKGISHYFYRIFEAISKNKLNHDFLQMWTKVGLITPIKSFNLNITIKKLKFWIKLYFLLKHEIQHFKFFFFYYKTILQFKRNEIKVSNRYR